MNHDDANYATMRVEMDGSLMNRGIKPSRDSDAEIDGEGGREGVGGRIYLLVGSSSRRVRGGAALLIRGGGAAALLVLIRGGGGGDTALPFLCRREEGRRAQKEFSQDRTD